MTMSISRRGDAVASVERKNAQRQQVLAHRVLEAEHFELANDIGNA